jgi:SAM-dependent methyltransferase
LPLRAVARTRRQTLLRVWGDHAFARWRPSVRGVVLDLASGSGASYRQQWDGAAQVVGVDLDRRRHPDAVADLLRPLPFRPGSADVVVLSWFLYIAPAPTAVLEQVADVLRPGGRLLLSVPLVFPFTPEPTDHWRFTAEGVSLVLRQAGFTDVEVVPLGDRWAAAVSLVDPFLRPRPVLAPLAYGAAVLLDRLAARLGRGWSPCPIGYAVRAVKGGAR